MRRLRIRAQENADTVTIPLYGVIGGDLWVDDDAIAARDLVRDLEQLPDTVRKIVVRVNSVGGDPFEATAIANTLREQSTKHHRSVDVVIDGVAASAASVLIMAGNTIRIHANALVMVHNPWILCAGNEAQLRKFADDLRVVKRAIIATYRWHSALEETELAALMDAETWMDADEAIARGFATEKVANDLIEESDEDDAVPAMNARVLARLTVPDRFKGRVAALTTPKKILQTDPPAANAMPAIDVVRMCEAEGCLELASRLIAASLPADQVRAQVEAEVGRRRLANEREREITMLCKSARLSMLADGYIRGGMSALDVRQHLVAITAIRDHGEIDGSLFPNDNHGHHSQRIDIAGVYEARRR